MVRPDERKERGLASKPGMNMPTKIVRWENDSPWCVVPFTSLPVCIMKSMAVALYTASICPLTSPLPNCLVFNSMSGEEETGNAVTNVKLQTEKASHEKRPVKDKNTRLYPAEKFKF